MGVSSEVYGPRLSHRWPDVQFYNEQGDCGRGDNEQVIYCNRSIWALNADSETWTDSESTTTMHACAIYGECVTDCSLVTLTNTSVDESR